jgi:zinc transport system ATP-binding protein
VTARPDESSRTSDSGALLRCRDLRVGHRGAPILPPIDARFGSGEFWVVVGRNGSGKTTWFRTMLGLLPAIGGRVERGSDLRIAYVPQRSELDPLFPLAARDVVALGVDRGWSFVRPRFFESKAVDKALSDVDALALADRPFRDLSEGQKARVLLARMIASDPHIAFLDEPTAAMDVVAERAAFDYLEKFRKERDTTVVVVSHFLGIAKDFATHAIFFDRDCNTVVVGSPDEVFGHADFHRSYPDVREALERG